MSLCRRKAVRARVRRVLEYAIRAQRRSGKDSVKPYRVRQSHAHDLLTGDGYHAIRVERRSGKNSAQPYRVVQNHAVDLPLLTVVHSDPIGFLFGVLTFSILY